MFVMMSEITGYCQCFVLGILKVGTTISHQVLGSTLWQQQLTLTLLASLFRR